MSLVNRNSNGFNPSDTSGITTKSSITSKDLTYIRYIDMLHICFAQCIQTLSSSGNPVKLKSRC